MTDTQAPDTQPKTAPCRIYVRDTPPPDPEVTDLPPLPVFTGLSGKLAALEVGQFLIVEVEQPYRRKVVFRLDAAKVYVLRKNPTKTFRLRSFWNGVAIERTK
jgi:hypothetical protein